MVKEPSTEEMERTYEAMNNAREYAREATDYSEWEDQQILITKYCIEELPDEYDQSSERVAGKVAMLIFQQEYGYEDGHTAASVTKDGAVEDPPVFFCQVAGGEMAEALDGFRSYTIPEMEFRRE